MKETLQRLCGYEVLSARESYALLMEMMGEEVSPAQMASLLSSYAMRKPSVQELLGFRSAMLDLCLKPAIDATEAVDIVGTGGDGKNTFNISTLTCFVLAGAGVKVVKHGNYAASSVSGSSNVLEHLGYRFTNESEALQRQLDGSNVCFLHAPLFHPAMKKVAPVRRDLGVQTFFNLLGPLINPAQPGKQVLGISKPEHLRLYQYLLQEIGQDFQLVHSLDGYDEISLTGSFKVVSPKDEKLYNPAQLGFQKADKNALSAGGSVEAAADIFLRILKGEGSSTQQQVVIVNSAFALHHVFPQKSLADCIEIARESLESGKAFQVLQQITHS